MGLRQQAVDEGGVKTRPDVLSDDPAIEQKLRDAFREVASRQFGKARAVRFLSDVLRNSLTARVYGWGMVPSSAIDDLVLRLAHDLFSIVEGNSNAERIPIVPELDIQVAGRFDFDVSRR